MFWKKTEKIFLSPNQKETFQYFHINIFNFLVLKPTEEKFIEGHVKLQQPVMLKCLVGPVALELSLLPKG